MKFYKRLPLDQSNVQSDKFAVLNDNRITTNTKVALEVPKGGNIDRPGLQRESQIRYNDVSNEYEVYNSLGSGRGWEIVRTVRPAPITAQNLGLGDYAKTDFGPLRFSSGENYTEYTRPQNVMVYIENVYQIPVTNYSLIQGTGTNVLIRFTSPPPTKTVTALLGFDGNFPPFNP